jgi:DNA polymerase-3 subunit epsilon
MESGLNGEDKSCVLVWKGKFFGMGCIPNDIQIVEPAELKELLTPYKENLFIRNLVNAYAARYPNKVKVFTTETVQSIN